MTRYPTYIEDTNRKGTFKIYADFHYASWLVFAETKGCEESVIPFLVSGVEVTRDLTMTAYANKGTTSFGAGFVITLPFVNTSTSIRNRHSTNSPESHHWPLVWSTEPINIPPEQTTPPNGFDCCVFIRYYTKDFIDGPGGWLPFGTLLSARTLRLRDSRPGSTARPGAGHAASGGEDLGEGWVDIPDDTVRDTLDVWLQPRPFVSTDFRLQDVGLSDFGGLAAYIYQVTSFPVFVIRTLNPPNGRIPVLAPP